MKLCAIVLQKNAHGRSTLRVCQRKGVGALLNVSAFNHKRRTHV